MTANILLSLVFGAVFLVTSPVHAATDPGDACKDAKAKATGRKASDLLKAIGKNVKKSDLIKLSASVSKAQSKLTKSFVKAEGKGGCLTTGDVGALEAKTDTFAMDATTIIISGQECGNDIQEGLEECDGTDAAGCPVGCKGDCTCAVCGDDVREGTEECDGSDAPGCSGLCQVNCQCPVPTCANGVLEAGEECDPPCSTGGACGGGEICGVTCACVPADPCNCGSPDPTTLEFASTLPNGGGVCGAVKNGADAILRDLNCANGYIGGGDVGVDPKQPVHTATETVYNIECCYGTTLALTATTAGETGSNRNCSSAGCTQGGPNPVPMATEAFSTCVVETHDEDATGWADCSTGAVSLRESIRTTIYLTGDDLPFRCSGGANPGGLCQDDTDCTPGGTCENDFGEFQCVGGANAGSACVDTSECPDGTCEAIDLQPCPLCNTSTFLCNGGVNDGLACTPESADTGVSYLPTTYDCLPDPGDIFGGTFLPHNYSTDPAQIETTTDGQFCKFCRDINGTNTNCYEGDARITCPNSATGPCKPQLGQTSECGTPTPCEADADCFAPYETCTQRVAGALDFPSGRTLEVSGSAAGDLTDRMPHAARLATIDCIPSTFITFQDNTADFPGPGAFSVVGPMQLKP